ncbi:hypothetical protein ACFOLD_12395 [Kocuria carniphila]
MINATPHLASWSGIESGGEHWMRARGLIHDTSVSGSEIGAS